MITCNPIREQDMRETADLVGEMLEEAKAAWLVAIAVGFENDTKFVFSTQNQPLAALNRLVEKGGHPIGLLRFEKQSSRVEGSYRPFEEYANEEWVLTYLAGLLDNMEYIISLSQQLNPLPSAY